MTHDAQPIQELLNSFRALSGFFYPTENLEYTGDLAYYRQREWRIIGGMKRHGHEVTRSLAAPEAAALLEIDSEFFEKRLRFPTAEYRRIDQCLCLPELDGRSFLGWARRIVVPEIKVREAKELMEELDIKTPVVAASAVDVDIIS